jgi:iron complex outermembrane receptor protein
MQRSALLASACASVWAITGMVPAWGATADAAGARAPTVGEVIVTAERREENIQKVPLAISVYSGRQLVQAGVTDTRDITNLDPGVQIGQGGPVVQTYIRGVGDFGSTPQTNPAVAINIDGVYISRGNAVEGNFYDLSNVEVLKGPQGTLYGRNADGGAINILTSAPQLGVHDAHVEAEVGNYDLARLEGFVNVPLGDDLALRASAQLIGRNGYDLQGFDDDKQQSVRLQALWKPTDKFRLRLIADYEHIEGVGAGYLFKGPLAPDVADALGELSPGTTPPSNPRVPFTDSSLYTILQVADTLGAGQQGYSCIPAGSKTLSSNTGAGIYRGVQGVCPAGYLDVAGLPPSFANAGQNNNDANFTAQMDYDLGFATLTVIPAYRYVANEYVTFPISPYTDFAPGQPETSGSASLEARLAHTAAGSYQAGSSLFSPLTWVVGAFAYQERQNQPQELSAGGQTFANATSYSDTRIETLSGAVFGEGNYSVTDKWRIIAGARYTVDYKQASWWGEELDSGANRHFLNPNTLVYSLDAFNPALSNLYPLPNALANDFYKGPAYVLPGSLFGDGNCYGKASPCMPDVPEYGAKSWPSFTYKVGTEYDLTPRNMIYITYSTGEKSGGFNVGLAQIATNPHLGAYNPEKLGALDFGSKNEFFNSRLQLNFEGFYDRYKDAQETFVGFNPLTDSATFGTANAASATIWGFDLSVIARLSEADTLTFAGEYLNSRINDFTYETSNLTTQETGCKITAGKPVEFGVILPVSVNCSGEPLQRAPEWSGTASFTHVFTLDSGAKIDAKIDAQASSSRYLGLNYSPQELAQGYIVGDAYLTYHAPSAKWSLSGYVRNFTDALVYTGAFTIPQNAPGVTVTNLGPPLAFGAILSVDF